MTIASEANRSGPYACDGVATSFPYSFKIYDEAHVRVILTDEAGVETTLALGADYAVTGVGADGGGAVETVLAHPVGCLVTLVLNVPFTQEIDLENQGAYFAETIERALDVLTQQALQLKELIGRSVVLPVTSTVSTTDLVSATLALAEIKSKMVALVEIAPDIQTVAGMSSEIIAAQGNAEAASTAAGTAMGAAGVATGAATTATQAATLADELANAAPQTPVGSGFSARHWAAVAQALSDDFNLDSYLTTDQIPTLLENYVPATRTIAGGAGVKINGADSASLAGTITVGLDLATDAETIAGETRNKPTAPAGVHAAIAAALASPGLGHVGPKAAKIITTSGNYIPTQGTRFVMILAKGGGGGGNGGRPGAQGLTGITFAEVDPAQIYPVVVGAGGGGTTGQSGGSGGSSHITIGGAQLGAPGGGGAGFDNGQHWPGRPSPPLTGPLLTLSFQQYDRAGVTSSQQEAVFGTYYGAGGEPGKSGGSGVVVVLEFGS